MLRRSLATPTEEAVSARPARPSYTPCGLQNDFALLSKSPLSNLLDRRARADPAAELLTFGLRHPGCVPERHQLRVDGHSPDRFGLRVDLGRRVELDPERRGGDPRRFGRVTRHAALLDDRVRSRERDRAR